MKKLRARNLRREASARDEEIVPVALIASKLKKKMLQWRKIPIMI
jgi:hypothetical protein